ncbi:MAG: glycosyltransferase family 2 protein [Patescibacteria group bacterium]|jgi:glycosyltransferase involved in cell wall biosynthesis
MKLAILIPAYDEEKTIGQVLKKIPQKLPHIDEIEVVVISDGSHDQTANIAIKLGATVIEHDLNRGLGGALGTGFEYAKINDFDYLLTFDADGQHNYRDIWPVLRPIVYKKADVSIGSRLKEHKGMPWHRMVGIWGLNLVTYLFFWVWTTDSQSGLRAFSKKAIHSINIQANRMEVSSEFFYEAGKKNLKITEVSIESIYTDYSLNKGQKSINAFKILAKMAYRRFFSK